MRPVNILNLPDWTIVRTIDGPRDYQITATYDVAAVACHTCWRFGFLQRFGKRNQLFLDLPMHGKRVGIYVERQRYRCTNCRHTMLQPLPHMDEKHQMTKRLLSHIGELSLRRTFISIAEECGLDEKTVRNVFHEHVRHLDETTVFATPKWLGIDELTLLRHPRCIMTNLEERTIIALLKNRSQATVSQYLHDLHRRGRVEIVAMDMWEPYRNAVQRVLHRPRIIVDKFHVVRMANQGLETIRRELRQTLTDRQRRTLMHDGFVLLRRQADLTDKDRMILEVWTEHMPLLAQAYQAKEQFYGIWDARDKQGAEAAYETWRATLSRELEGAFHPLLTALGNWHDEIFAYFTVPGASITNATTEAPGGLAKLAQHSGRGYSYEAIRAKLLYGIGTHRQIPETYRQAAYRRIRVAPHFEDHRQAMSLQLNRPELMLDLGAELSTVCRDFGMRVPDDESTG
jgi:transposase